MDNIIAISKNGRRSSDIPHECLVSTNSLAPAPYANLWKWALLLFIPRSMEAVKSEIALMVKGYSLSQTKNKRKIFLGSYVFENQWNIEIYQNSIKS